MEIATVIGVDPAILIASIFKIPRGVDKLSVAGGLKGKPIPMVKAETVDIDIPANGEIVIEGFIDPKAKEKDGTAWRIERILYDLFKKPHCPCDGYHLPKRSLSTMPSFPGVLRWTTSSTSSMVSISSPR